MRKLLQSGFKRQFLSYQVFTMNAKRELAIRARATELREKRTEEKSKPKSITILNCADFQVIGSAYQGSTPSLIVRSEGNSYIFNCGEGMQRLCYSNRIKLIDLENVFITRHSWDRVAGALGLALTIQDIGSLKLCIHSSEGIEDFFESTSHFTQFTSGIKCLTNSYQNGVYEDSGIRIQPIIQDDSYFPKTPESSAKKLKSKSTLLAYNCKLPDLPGALNPQKCRELNVPIGRELGLLKSGKDIVLANGSVVKSVDVCYPKSIGLNFLVVDCSTERKIDYLFSNNTLKEIRKLPGCPNEEKRQVGIVMHLSPPEVINNNRYQDWIKGFPDTCKHFILSDKNSPRLDFIDSYRLQYLMNKLDNEIFPLMNIPDTLSSKFEEELSRTEEDVLVKKSSLDPDSAFSRVNLEDLEKITYVGSLDKINIRPHKSAEFKIDNMNVDQLYDEARVELNFEKLLEQLQKLQQNLPTGKAHEPELVFLGTGSAVPNKFRNTSGILVNFSYPREASVILDCGEDTLGQLCRFYGPIKKDQILKNLKLIYVSHQHTDHHIGLLNILNERNKLTKEKVILLLPPGLDKLLNYHNQNFQDISDTYEIFCTSRLKTVPASGLISTPTSDVLIPEITRKTGGLISNLSVVGVSHCINSCAVNLSFKIGHPEMRTFSIAYSGDARPSKDFVLAAKGCDLLIHEATFDHRSQEDAHLKKHSTTTDAIRVGREMEAKFTILTHFTQRYSKIPYFTKDFDDNVGFAFDFMSIKCPSNFPRLPILKPILSKIFKKYFERADALYQKNIEHQKVVSSLLRHDKL